MCIGGSPSVPAPPPPPPAPPPPPKKTDPAVQQARVANRQQAALMQGRQDTILTSGQGLTDPVNQTAKKSLLGT